MENPLVKIAELVKATGDNCVVLDSEGNPAYVIVSFEKYQQLVENKGKNQVLPYSERLPFDTEKKANISQKNTESEKEDVADKRYQFEPID